MVIQFLRINGFNAPQPKKLKNQGDCKVQKVGDRFRVVIVHNGKKKFKTVDSLEDAMKEHHTDEDDYQAQNAGDQNDDEPADDRDEHIAKHEDALDEQVSAELGIKHGPVIGQGPITGNSGLVRPPHW